MYITVFMKLCSIAEWLNCRYQVRIQ
jgi:hypothetical protein